MAEVKLAKKLGYCTDLDETLVQDILEKAKLPTKIPDYIDREKLLKKLYTDKIVKNGALRFVLQKRIGDVVSFGDNLYAKEIPESAAREIIMSM